MRERMTDLLIWRPEAAGPLTANISQRYAAETLDSHSVRLVQIELGPLEKGRQIG